MADDAPSVLTDLMASGWTRYRKTLKRARLLMTDEAVHDLRVALRRLETTVDLLRLFLPNSQTQETARTLRNFRKNFGVLRDVQVQILSLSDLTNEYPDLLKFQRCLGKRERKLIQNAKQIIRKKRPKLEKRFCDTLAQSRDFLRMFTRIETERTIISAIDGAYERVIERKRVVDRRDTSGIHRLRIAFKKFRYTFETVVPVLRDLPDDLPERMRDIQDMMGKIRDAEVLFETLHGWGQKRKKKTRRSLEPVYEALAQRRRNCIDSFLADIDEIRRLWKPHTQQKTRPVGPVAPVATTSR